MRLARSRQWKSIIILWTICCLYTDKLHWCVTWYVCSITCEAIAFPFTCLINTTHWTLADRQTDRQIDSSKPTAVYRKCHQTCKWRGWNGYKIALLTAELAPHWTPGREESWFSMISARTGSGRGGERLTAPWHCRWRSSNAICHKCVDISKINFASAYAQRTASSNITTTPRACILHDWSTATTYVKLPGRNSEFRRRVAALNSCHTSV